MPEESYSFANARTRLEDIVSQVRKKDTSLEKSLDLLEEGVRLANQCTELIDHADWESVEAAGSAAQETDGAAPGASDAESLVDGAPETNEEAAAAEVSVSQGESEPAPGER